MVGPGVIEAGCEDEAAADVGPLLHSPQQLLTGSEQETASKPSPSKGGSRAVKSPLGACRLRDGGGAAVRPMGIALLHWALSLNQRPPAMIARVSAFWMEKLGSQTPGYWGFAFGIPFSGGRHHPRASSEVEARLNTIGIIDGLLGRAREVGGVGPFVQQSLGSSWPEVLQVGVLGAIVSASG